MNKINYKNIFKNEINKELSELISDGLVEFPLYTKCVLKKEFKNYKVWHLEILEKETNEKFHVISLVLFNNRDDQFKAFNGLKQFDFVNDDYNQQANYIKWMNY